MTPFELSNTIHKEINDRLPRLAAAVNKALLYYGERSSILGPDGSKTKDDTDFFEESETIKVEKDEGPAIMLKVMEMGHLLEQHSGWRLVCDTKSAKQGGRMEFRYTLMREESA